MEALATSRIESREMQKSLTHDDGSQTINPNLDLL